MKCTIRDLLWLMLVAALIWGWWFDRSLRLEGVLSVVQGNIELRQENERLMELIGSLYQQKKALERENQTLKNR